MQIKYHYFWNVPLIIGSKRCRTSFVDKLIMQLILHRVVMQPVLRQKTTNSKLTYLFTQFLV
jgi:hypothetical protein